VLAADDPYERQLLVEHLRRATPDGALLYVACGRREFVFGYARAGSGCTGCGSARALLHDIAERAPWCVPCGLERAAAAAGRRVRCAIAAPQHPA
jgi:hypothetical protein